MDAVIRRQAFKFELRPDGAQVRAMRRFAGARRYVYNRALALQKERFRAGEPKLGYAGLCKALTGWKSEPDTAWLNDAPSQPLQQALKQLEAAYKGFFEQRAAFPRFKKKGVSDAFVYPQGVKLDQANCRVFLPKLGWLRYRASRAVPGTVKNVTVSAAAGKWFISVQTEREVEQPVPTAATAVGLDVGVEVFAATSDGALHAPTNSFKRHEKALAKAQRRMSHKTKFSRNWVRAKARVQQIHARIANVRKDYLHRLSHTLSKNHALVFVEDLQVRNMSASAAGTADAPGRKVRQKSGLNKAILDQGWAEFRRQLDYKLAWAGGHLVAVPPQYSSQTCPACGLVAAENRRSRSVFECVACGCTGHADVIAARNLLLRGRALLQNEGQDTADASAGCPGASPGTARIVCEVNGAVRPSAAETRRDELAALTGS